MLMVYQVCEDLENKTHFTPEEIIHMLSYILENNPTLISYNDEK